MRRSYKLCRNMLSHLQHRQLSLVQGSLRKSSSRPLVLLTGMLIFIILFQFYFQYSCQKTSKNRNQRILVSLSRQLGIAYYTKKLSLFVEFIRYYVLGSYFLAVYGSCDCPFSIGRTQLECVFGFTVYVGSLFLLPNICCLLYPEI